MPFEGGYINLIDTGQASYPRGTRGNDLGGCKVYAKSPVDGKLAIVWKEEPKQIAGKHAATKEVKQVAAKHQTISGTGNTQKPWAGYQSKRIENGGFELTIRYSESGDRYFAVAENSTGEAKFQGAVDERGNLETADGSEGLLYIGYLKISGHVLRIKVTSDGSRAGSRGVTVFVDKNLAQRIKEEPNQVSKTEPKMADVKQPAIAAASIRAEVSNTNAPIVDGRYISSIKNKEGVTWTLEIIINSQEIK